jgi:hypothetical protein
MSELRVDTLSTPSGSGIVDLGNQYGAKASVIALEGGVGITHSYNISSYVDGGAGIYYYPYIHSFVSQSKTSSKITSGRSNYPIACGGNGIISEANQLYAEIRNDDDSVRTDCNHEAIIFGDLA